METRKRPVVVISAGHTKEMPGAERRSDPHLIEHTEATKVVAILSTDLSKYDLDVHVLTGRLADKIRRANELMPRAAVEVHFNSCHDFRVGGTETLYGSDPRDKVLAVEIQQQLVDALRLKNRGVKFDDYAGTPEVDECAWTRDIDHPAVIVEPLFLSNADEAGLLRPTPPSVPPRVASLMAGGNENKKSAHRVIAEAIADGICEFLARDDCETRGRFEREQGRKEARKKARKLRTAKRD